MDIKKTIVFLITAALILTATTMVDAKSGGIENKAVDGCGNCHGSTASGSVLITLNGLDSTYTPSQTYALSLSVSGGAAGTQGGFNLEVSAGTLSTTDSDVTINSAQDQATHNNDLQRSWTLSWTAPGTGTGTVNFNVAAVTANGNNQKDSGDLWNTYSTSVPEAPSVDNPPTVSITTPNNNEMYEMNSFIAYYWTATDDKAWGATPNAWIYYDTDTNPGNGKTLLTSSVAASAGTYWWNNTGVPNGNYYAYIEVQDSASQTASDYSDTPFTIYDKEPIMTVTNPNGGESYEAGTSVGITWTAYEDNAWAGAPNCWIYYDTDTNSGNGETLITSSVDASTQSYSWDTTGVATGSYYIHIVGKDSANQNGDDYSDNTFAITTPLPPNNAPTLGSSVFSPATGDQTTVFSFSVVYTDADDDAPNYIRAHIDGDSGHTMSLDSSASAALKDGDYTNGEQYVYTTTFSTGGVHTFHFETSDGEDTARDPASGEHSGPDVTITIEPNNYATSDIPGVGTVSGDYTDTHGSDDTYQSITEYSITKGKPSKRTRYLEHKWTVDVSAQGDISFEVEAHTSAEPFTFYYSIDDIYYLEMLTVSTTSLDVTETFTEMPSSFSGTVYIKVMDTIGGQGDTVEDIIYIDQMYILVISGTPLNLELATGDLPGRGTVNNNYFFTHVSDNNYEELTERQSGGKPANRHSLLIHQWTFDVDDMSSFDFFVEAYHTANGEGEDFTFSYSTDGTTFTDILTVTKTSDDDTAQSGTVNLGSAFTGTIYIQVVDTDDTPGNKILDTLYIDYMYIA
jgi:hypothetical protein